MSLAQAPLFFNEGAGGDLEVGLREDMAASEGEISRLSGDFAEGVEGYDVVGGNALLPVRRPVQQTALLVPLGGVVTAQLTPGVLPGVAAGVLGDTVIADVGLANAEGELSPRVAVGVGQLASVDAGAVVSRGAGVAAGATAGLTQGLASAGVGATVNRTTGVAGAVGASAAQGLAGVAGSVGAAGASAAGAVTAATPGAIATVGAAAQPVTATVTRTLTTQGALLGTPATVAATTTTARSLSGAAVNSLLGGMRARP